MNSCTRCVVLLSAAAGLFTAQMSQLAAAEEKEESAPQVNARGQSSPGPADPAPAQPAAEGVEAKKNDVTSIFSKANVSQHTLQREGADSTTDAVKNVAGVTPANTKSGDFSDDIQIRGIHLNATSSYRLDGGLAIANNTWLPLMDKDHVEALKGASALLFGLANPAGVINYVTKRPLDESYNSASFSGNGYGLFVGSLDVSRRYGDELGVRINLSGTNYDTYIRGVDGAREFSSVAVDWNPTPIFGVKVTFEQWAFGVTEQGTILENKAVNNIVQLPHFLDPTKHLSGDWSRYQATGENGQIQAGWLLGYGWKLFSEIGVSEADKAQRNQGQMQNYNLATGWGNLKITEIRDQDYTNFYLNDGLKHTFEGSFFTNNFTFGINRNERYFNSPSTTSVTMINGKLIAQNLYNPIVIPFIPGPKPVVDSPQDSVDWGVYVYDTLTLWDRLHVVAGVRHVNYNVDDVRIGKPDFTTATQLSTPSYGVVLDVTKKIEAYASLLKGLEETGAAPVNSANAFQILPPALSTQKEIGLRVKNWFDTTGSVAYFNINRANAVIGPPPPTCAPLPPPCLGTYALDGTINYEGIETTVRHVFTEEWSVRGVAQWTRAIQNAPNDPAINGKVAENTPFFGGNVSLTYAPYYIPGLALTGGTTYVGKREINPQDQGRLPSVLLYNMGAEYKTILYDKPTTFTLSASNLLDTKYWSSSVNNALGVGAPLTIRFGMRFDF
jgi:iron complex outermembrane recepter protein